MFRKVISLALFGANTRYAVYAGSVVRAYRTLFPDAEIWVHHDEDLDSTAGGRVLRRVAERGIVRLVAMVEAPLTAAMLWRVHPIWEPGVDFVFARDIDALPTPRERYCVDRFVVSGMILHTVHDSSSHDGIMGGLSGFEAEGFRARTGLASLDDLYQLASFSREKWATHGTDQDALNGKIAPRLWGHVFEHMYDGWRDGHPGPRPDPRRETKYLGLAEYVPDEVVFPGRVAAWTCAADALVPHMGAAGHDYEGASRFYDREGDPGEMTIVREAEEAEGVFPGAAP